MYSMFRRTAPALEHYYFPHNPLMFSSFLRSISSDTSSKHTNQVQFTVSYLVNSCGFSLESAKSASKRFQLKTPDKPDLFLTLLKNYNFSQTQISKVVKCHPRLLLSNPEKTVLPKLEFLRSKGLSNHEIANFLSSCPYILKISLRNSIIPTYDLLKGLFQSDEKTVAAIKRLNEILFGKVEAAMVRNISILRDNGVPESCISRLLNNWPGILVLGSDRIERGLEEVRDQMGFDPSTYTFLQAFVVRVATRNSTWESKVDVFKRWHLSAEQVLAGFRQYPRIMSTSEKRMMAIMDFLLNKMGWEPSFIAKHLKLITLSLDRRLIPRALVFQYLVAKGLLKRESISPATFEASEAKFKERFIKRHPEAPELLKLYGERSALP